LPPEAEEASAGNRSGDKKGKARNGGQYQAQSGVSNKRKREAEDVLVEEKPRKKSKVQQAVLESGKEGGDGQKTAEVKKKKAQPQRFILFIGEHRVLVLHRLQSNTHPGRL
jgi:hypothetical protein